MGVGAASFLTLALDRAFRKSGGAGCCQYQRADRGCRRGESGGHDLTPACDGGTTPYVGGD